MLENCSCEIPYYMHGNRLITLHENIPIPVIGNYKDSMWLILVGCIVIEMLSSFLATFCSEGGFFVSHLLYAEQENSVSLQRLCIEHIG